MASKPCDQASHRKALTDIISPSESTSSDPHWQDWRSPRGDKDKEALRLLPLRASSIVPNPGGSMAPESHDEYGLPHERVSRLLPPESAKLKRPAAKLADSFGSKKKAPAGVKLQDVVPDNMKKHLEEKRAAYPHLWQMAQGLEREGRMPGMSMSEAFLKFPYDEALELNKKIMEDSMVEINVCFERLELTKHVKGFLSKWKK